MDAQMPDCCSAIPELVKQAARRTVQLRGNVSGVVQNHLMAGIAQIKTFDSHRHQFCLYLILPEPGAHRLGKPQKYQVGDPGIRHIKGNGGRIAETLLRRRVRLHRGKINSIGKSPDNLAVFFQMRGEKLGIACRKFANRSDTKLQELGGRGPAHKK